MIIIIFIFNYKVKNLNSDARISIIEKRFQTKFILFVTNFLLETVHWRSCVRARIHMKKLIHRPIVLNICVKSMRFKYARRCSCRSQFEIFRFSSELLTRALCVFIHAANVQ